MLDGRVLAEPVPAALGWKMSHFPLAGLPTTAFGRKQTEFEGNPFVTDRLVKAT